MKILHATIRYYPALGGVEEYVQRISEGLVKAGNSVTVCTSDLAQHTGKLVRVNAGPGEVNGVRVIRRSALPIKMRHYSVMPFLPAVLFKEQADIVHGHCFMSFPMDAACCVSRMRKIPFIFNPYFTQLSVPSCFGKLYRKTLGRAAMNADAVVVISEFERRIIEEAGYRPRRFEMIPPGVDHEQFDTAAHNVYDRYGLGGRRVILFVGRLDANKGIDVLLKAANVLVKDFSDLAFVIAGDDFGARQSLERMVRETHLDRHVFFTGKLSRPDLVSAYKHACIFAFPSLYEAFGIVLIEAMAAGIPVVASNTSAIPYVVRHSETGLLFDPGNSRALADALAGLLRDDRLQKRMGEEGRRYAREHFSWQRTIDAALQLYESVL